MLWRPTDEEIVAAVLAFEGSRYTDHPADRGGPTKFGITRGAWARYRGMPVAQVTARDIERLTRPDAVAYYLAMHLTPFARLADPLRHQMVDLGVHRGVESAAQVLQRLVGADPDGAVGARTARTVAAFGSVERTNNLVVGARLQHFANMIRADPAQARWRNGWWNRALSFYVEAA